MTKPKMSTTAKIVIAVVLLIVAGVGIYFLTKSSSTDEEDTNETTPPTPPTQGNTGTTPPTTPPAVTTPEVPQKACAKLTWRKIGKDLPFEMPSPTTAGMGEWALAMQNTLGIDNDQISYGIAFLKGMDVKPTKESFGKYRTQIKEFTKLIKGNDGDIIRNPVFQSEVIGQRYTIGELICVA